MLCPHHQPVQPVPLLSVLMSAASYIRIWLASVSVILGTVAAFNLVIDPYDVSRLLEMPRLNAMKPAEFGRARLRKPFDLYFKSLVSATTVRDSIATISASWDGTPTLQHLPDGLLNIEQYFSAVGQPDYRSQFNGVDAAYLNSAYKPMLDRRAELERVGFDHSALTDMLRTAARFDLELHVFIPPGHARQAEVVRFLGLEPLFPQWLRELACVVASTESGKRSVRLWDFSGYNSVTTEPIPPFSSKDRMQWYRDSVHFSRRTGRAIVDTVLGFPPSELGKDQTFGVQVTPGTSMNISSTVASLESAASRPIPRSAPRSLRSIRARQCRASSLILSPDYPSRARQRWQTGEAKMQ